MIKLKACGKRQPWSILNFYSEFDWGLRKNTEALSRGCLSPGLVRDRDRTTTKVYSAVHAFWPAGELTELADGPTERDQMARGGCLFAPNFSVTRSTVLRNAERRQWTNHDAVVALVTRSQPTVRKFPIAKKRTLCCISWNAVSR